MASELLKRFKRLVTLETPVEESSKEASVQALDTTSAGGPPGELEETPHGPIRVIRRDVHADYPDDLPDISALLDKDTASLAGVLKDPRLAGFRREEALFLDVESTSLSHGAGNIAFLVGVGVFEDDHFVVEQYLMDDYDQEMAQLSRVLDRVEERRFLVSYNGKSFDKSILENRFVIQRFMDRKEAHLKLMPHLDLLHVGRRILGGTLPRHNLATLEESVLQFHREEDIPGELVPQVYFGYLMNPGDSLISSVVDHNYWDIVSLAYLSHGLLQFLKPGTPHGNPRIDYNVGRLYLEDGRPEIALGFLESALALGVGEVVVRAADAMTRAGRQLGHDRTGFESIWLAAWQRAPDSARVCIELSKCAEWGRRDLPQALHWAQVATQCDDARRFNGLNNRINRLKKKLGQ